MHRNSDIDPPANQLIRGQPTACRSGVTQRPHHHQHTHATIGYASGTAHRTDPATTAKDPDVVPPAAATANPHSVCAQHSPAAAVPLTETTDG
jgi:hypothetical protein